MPAERIGTQKEENVTANSQPASTVVVQASSGTAASTRINDTATAPNSVSLSSGSLLSQNLKPQVGRIVQQVGNSLASSAAEIIVQSPASLVTGSDGSNTKAITVTASPRGAAAVTTQMQTGVSAAMVTTDKSTLKRPLSGGASNSNVVTKVIITRNPSSSQPHAVPVQVAQLSSSAAASTSASGTVSILSQAMGSQTPTKTVTISSQGIVSPGKAVIATLPGSPTKVSIPVNKVPISPATKITMIPVSIAKSPQQRLAVAPGTPNIAVVPRTLTDLASTNSTGTTTVSKPATITMSPSKVIIKQSPNKLGQLKTQAQIAPAGQGPMTLQLPISVSGTSMQQVQVPGSKFHYVRLVSPSTQQAVTVTKPAGTSTVTKVIPATRQIAPASATSNQVKITLPVGQNVQLQSGKTGTPVGGQTVQRIILPAAPTSVPVHPAPSLSVAAPTSLAPIRPNLQSAATSLTKLPPGTTLLTPSNLPGLQGFALVPAHTMLEATGARPRKPCNCTKSQCLKLYCDCFANGEFCHNCNCTNCANNLEHEEERSRAIKSCLDRNPMAFHPKIGKGKDSDGNRRHNKGCNCKRSGCLKNYCECYEAKIMCSSFCKCIGCKNFEESSERKTLMHLADAAEVRVQQQTAAKTKLSSQISGIPSKPPSSSASGERLPFTLITADVAEATSACLLAQAEEAERLKMPPVVQERMVIEEFGRCLLQIIDSANKTKDVDGFITKLWMGQHNGKFLCDGRWFCWCKGEMGAKETSIMFAEDKVVTATELQPINSASTSQNYTRRSSFGGACRNCHI
ncbi:hypothetical protein BaRGS_00000702 [Batillaria attramentaria]|uniref:CRC domain-containing protein n=1 Tax=Batillaria attramentaria TaxID=370345 RepID=A0ABD0M7S3_9CAEN